MSILEEKKIEIENLQSQIELTPRMKNLTNKKQGHITFLKISHKKDNRNYWWTICDCGTIEQTRADSKKEQLSRLWNKLLIPSCDGYEILFNEGDLLKVSKNGTVISVTYANDSQLYRSLLLAAELIADGEDREIEEKEQFERKGVMLDMSRAGVMTVDAVKEYKIGRAHV